MQTQYEIYQGVITADIVNSQGLSEADYQDLMKALAEHLTQLSEEIGAVFHIFRGFLLQSKIVDFVKNSVFPRENHYFWSADFLGGHIF